MRRISIGIDTSNYKTSVAAVDTEGNILCNLQQYLSVKKGERGLRQSVALFQHVNNLPDLLAQLFETLRAAGEYTVDCIAVSEKPRTVEGSYMPCFQAGLSAAKSLAAALDVPCFFFSHQEGHIEAARFGTNLQNAPRFLSFHFSGGTSEGLLVSETDDGRFEISIEGGSKDLAFGQVLDRIGVALGMAFPCGQALDEIALKLQKEGGISPKENLLPVIKCKDGFINLSGIETCCQRLAETVEKERLAAMLFARLARAISEMTGQLSEKLGTEDVLFAGGVSASGYIRNELKKALPSLNLCFGDPVMCTDNAAGTALLGGKAIWR